MASNVWVKQGAGIDSSDVEIEGGVHEFSADNQLPDGFEVPPVATPTKVNFDLERFMAETVQVQLPEPMSESDPAFAEVTVNGIYVRVPRDGMPHPIKRFHLEALARAKQSRVRQRKVVHPDGSMGFVEETVLAMTYPFQVVHDPNPRGPAWLKSILASAR